MFFQRLFIRLGFLACLAVAIRLAGGLFSLAHPNREVPMTQVFDRAGNADWVPREAIETSSLAAPFSEPEMQTALMIVRNRHGGTLGTGSEARMTYSSPDGPVTLTPSDVAAVNAEYRRFRQVLAHAGDGER